MNISTHLPAIQSLLEDWQQALQSMNVERILSFYSDDLIAYDAIAQLQFCGKPAYQAHYTQCFQMCPGKMQWELRDLHVDAGHELAFCHALIHGTIVSDNGTHNCGWMRWTGCLRRSGQRWIFVHEHFSTPFDPMSGKVLGELQP